MKVFMPQEVPMTKVMVEGRVEWQPLMDITPALAFGELVTCVKDIGAIAQFKTESYARIKRIIAQEYDPWGDAILPIGKPPLIGATYGYAMEKARVAGCERILTLIYNRNTNSYVITEVNI